MTLSRQKRLQGLFLRFGFACSVSGSGFRIPDSSFSIYPILPLAWSKTDLSKRLSPAWSVFSFFSVWPLSGENLHFRAESNDQQTWFTQVRINLDFAQILHPQVPYEMYSNVSTVSVQKMQVDRWSLRLNTNLVCLVVFNDVPHSKECKRQWYMWALIWCFIYSYLGWISELYQFFRPFGSYRWCTGWER